MRGYNGHCDECGESHRFEAVLVSLDGKDKYENLVFSVIGIYKDTTLTERIPAVCPGCGNQIKLIRIYQFVEITNWLKE